MHSTARRRAAFAVTAAGLLLAATACGGDEQSGGGALEGLQPAEILQKTRAATEELQSFTLRGSGTLGEESEATVSMDRDGNCVGEITEPSGTMEFRRLGESVYLRTDDPEWFGGQAALGDRWVVPSEAGGTMMTFMCDPEAMLGSMLEDLEANDDWEPAEGTAVDGTDAIALARTADGVTSTVYIRDAEQAHVLRFVTEGGDNAGSVEFSALGEPVEVEAPPEDQTVTEEELRAEASGS